MPHVILVDGELLLALPMVQIRMIDGEPMPVIPLKDFVEAICSTYPAADPGRAARVNHNSLIDRVLELDLVHQGWCSPSDILRALDASGTRYFDGKAWGARQSRFAAHLWQEARNPIGRLRRQEHRYAPSPMRIVFPINNAGMSLSRDGASKITELRLSYGD